MNIQHALRTDLPLAVPVWKGYPRYNFTGGHNASDLIPIQALAQASYDALSARASELAFYNLGQGPLGLEDLRDRVVERLALSRGIKATRENVLITSGSAQGLDLVNAAFIEPGDIVITEEFTYAGALNKLHKVGARIIPAPLDAGGLDVSALEILLKKLNADGLKAKFIYVIPTVQNPTGSVMEIGRRADLIAVSEAFGVPIFEDECYAELAFSKDAPSALYGLAPQNVIYLGSFSKTLAPALRLGYVVAQDDVLRQIAASKFDGGTGAINQMVVAKYLEGDYAKHIDGLIANLKAKLALVVDAVTVEFGTSVDITKPEGGIFVWLSFPETFDVNSLVPEAVKNGLLFNAGSDWAVDSQSGKSKLRLCFGHLNEKEIREGVATLAEVCFQTAGFPKRRVNTARG